MGNKSDLSPECQKFVKKLFGLYSWKIAPTVSIIHMEIKDSIEISKSKLALTLIDLGYTYEKKPWILLITQ
jgi:hypothetical protein